jgi:hypothetical protein
MCFLPVSKLVENNHIMNDLLKYSQNFETNLSIPVKNTFELVQENIARTSAILGWRKLTISCLEAAVEILSR